MYYLLTNHLVSVMSVLSPFDSSDHSQVLFKVFVELPAESSEPTKHIFRCRNADDYRYLTSIKWDEFFFDY